MTETEQITRIENPESGTPEMKSRTKFAYIISAIAISCLMIGASMGIMISADTPTGFPTVIEPGSMVGEASYVIFTDGTNYYAKNGTTGAIDFSGSNLAVLFQTVCNVGGIISIAEGMYNSTVPSIISISESGTSIVGAGMGETNLQGIGFNITGGLSNITLESLTLTGTLPGFGVRITNDDHIKVSGIEIFQPLGAVAAFEIWLYVGGNANNVTFLDCQSIDSNGFGWLVGGAIGAFVENMTYESCKAVNSGLFGNLNNWATGYDLSENIPISNVLVSNCIASGSYESGFHIEPVVAKNVVIDHCISSNNGQKIGFTFGAGYFIGTTGVMITDSISDSNRFGFWLHNEESGGGRVNIISSCMDEYSMDSLRIEGTHGYIGVADFTSYNASRLSLSMGDAVTNVSLNDFTMVNTNGSASGYCTLIGTDAARSAENITVNNFVSKGTNGQDSVFFIGYGRNITIDGIYVDTNMKYAIVISNTRDVSVSNARIILRGASGSMAILAQVDIRLIISNVEVFDPVSATTSVGIAMPSWVDSFVRKDSVYMNGVSTPYSTDIAFDSNKGTALISASTSVVFSHFLYSTPTLVLASFSAASYGNYTWTATASEITIIVSMSGTYTVYWYAEV